MLIPGPIHCLGDGCPLETVLLDQFYQSEVFFLGPLRLGDDGVQVVVPLFPALIKLPEEAFIRETVKLYGYFLPVWVLLLPE